MPSICPLIFRKRTTSALFSKPGRTSFDFTARDYNIPDALEAKRFDVAWGVGVYGIVISVKGSHRFEPAEKLLLRWRIRRELKRLKAEREKLRLALSQVEQAKSAITNWSRKNR
jgi:hypothetical protein